MTETDKQQEIRDLQEILDNLLGGSFQNWHNAFGDKAFIETKWFVQRLHFLRFCDN